MRFLNRRNPNIINFIIYGLLYDTVINLWKPFSVKFLERLGGHEFEISLFNALPGLVAALVLLPGSVLINRFARKRGITAIFILISRAVILVMAFIPMLPAEARPMLFLVLAALMNCPDALSQTSLQSFLGDVFTGHERAQAITLRNKFGNAIVPIVTIATGLAITYIPANERQRMLLYQVFFVSAFLFGLLEVFVFNRFRENEKAALTAAKSINFKFSALGALFRDKQFTTFLWPVLLFAFFWQAGWPLCSVYQVNNLHANELWFAIISLTCGVGAYASAGFWQKFIRKQGNSFTLVVAAFLMAANLMIYPISPNVYVLALLCTFSGVAVMGVNTAMLNGVLEATPDENRLVYLALYNTILNISLFIAPFLSHLLLTNLGIYKAFYTIIAGRILSASVILIVHILKKAQ